MSAATRRRRNKGGGSVTNKGTQNMASLTMTRGPLSRVVLLFAVLLSFLPAVRMAGAQATVEIRGAEPAVIIGAQPTRLETEDTGVHGQLAVAPEVVSADTRSDLVYTIVAEPLHGRVGLAGAEEGADVFKTKTSRLGYFAYRPEEGFTGEDSFTYTVRNETSGLVFRNTVLITVKPPPAVLLQRFEVGADRARTVNTRGVTLTTRPNTPVAQKLPSHADFMSAADLAGVASPRIAYRLDEKAKPRHGTARLDATSGQFTYAPDPGFIGEDRLGYYTVDENNPHLGVSNEVVILVEPVRNTRRLEVDRSIGRPVDVVFVINNSPSMAAHQERIAANLGRFRRLFHARELDYRIGVLTTDFVNLDARLRPEQQRLYKEVRSARIDASGRPETDSRGRPQTVTKVVASNGTLVTLPVLPQPWVTPATPDGVFAELVKVGTNGDSNRTAFTAVYNFVAGFHSGQHAFLRPDAPTVVILFMDEEETRMARWNEDRAGRKEAEWVEDGRLPDLLRRHNARHPKAPQTLDGYINQWVLRPFIIAKGNRRGAVEMHAVVAPDNVSHRRAAELTGGTVLNIRDEFSEPLAALGDRIADTVMVPLEPVSAAATFFAPSLKVRVNGQEVPADARDGFSYDASTHSVRFQGAAKQKAHRARIEITYEEHM